MVRVDGGSFLSFWPSDYQYKIVINSYLWFGECACKIFSASEFISSRTLVEHITSRAMPNVAIVNFVVKMHSKGLYIW